jgi:hypothetical protein
MADWDILQGEAKKKKIKPRLDKNGYPIPPKKKEEPKIQTMFRLLDKEVVEKISRMAKEYRVKKCGSADWKDWNYAFGRFIKEQDEKRNKQ